MDGVYLNLETVGAVKRCPLVHCCTMFEECPNDNVFLCVIVTISPLNPHLWYSITPQHCRRCSSSHLVSLSAPLLCCHSLLPPQVSLISLVCAADVKQQANISIINSHY